MNDDLLKQIIVKVDLIEDQNKTHHREFTGFKEEFSGFKEKTDNKLNTIIEQVARNSEQLTSLSEQLASLSKAQASLISGQQKQDKILEVLAVRSLEQETDIKDLKRIK